MDRRIAALCLAFVTIGRGALAAEAEAGPRITPAIVQNHAAAASAAGRIAPLARPPVPARPVVDTPQAARLHAEEARIARDRTERVIREDHGRMEAERLARIHAEREESRRYYRLRAEAQAEEARRLRAGAYVEEQEAARVRAEAEAQRADQAAAMAEAQAARAQQLASMPVAPPAPVTAARGVALDSSNHPIDYEYALQGYTKGVPNSFFDAGRPH